jgi:hypothetical protein
MSFYRKKPVVIEAFRWTGGPDQTEDHVWTVSAIKRGDISFIKVAGEVRMKISTLEGDMYAQSGDYIIKGIKGEIYPCRSDIFLVTYDEVTQPHDAKESNGRGERPGPNDA